MTTLTHPFNVNGKPILSTYKDAFIPKDYDDIVNRAIELYEKIPQARTVDISDKKTGRSLGFIQKTISPSFVKEDLNYSGYASEQIKDFLRKNDTTSPYFPTIKFFGERADTKHLSISWDLVEKIAQLIEKESRH